ncbi:TPA: peptidylprolyl isomerase [Candidatus Latescibacteria bacterium]|nr:peptidylprolyl isomerase [Candidatus Latescibacterota bacterium]
MFKKLINALTGSGDAVREGVQIDKPIPVDGYQKSDTGLEYTDLTVGTGTAAAKGNQATVHYTGWLTSGKRFDCSAVKNKPFTFTIGARKVIKGWDQGVDGMKVGGIRQLRVPPNLAYGPMGRPPRIPKNATLVFEIELLAIK